MGSGSACRSVYGGFVAWRMGKLDDGSDSIAEQVASQQHWPQLKALILVVSMSLCVSTYISTSLCVSNYISMSL